MRLIISVLALISGLLMTSCDVNTELEAKFLACLEKTSGDEQVCLAKLGPAAWMPQNDAACEAVAARVEAILEAQGLVRYPDLLRNERCARLDRPHNKEAAAAGSRNSNDRSYVECYNSHPATLFGACSDIAGPHKWYPVSDKECPALTRLLAKYETDPLDRAWRLLFHNERCRRLERDFYIFRT